MEGPGEIGKRGLGVGQRDAQGNDVKHDSYDLCDLVLGLTVSDTEQLGVNVMNIMQMHMPVMQGLWLAKHLDCTEHPVYIIRTDQSTLLMAEYMLVVQVKLYTRL